MRIQFQLLFAVAAISAGLANARDESSQSKAIRKVELLGGTVSTDGDSVVSVSFKTNNRFNEKYLYLLKPFTKLAKLDLFDIPTTDIGVKEIGHYRNLTVLCLSGTKVTDEGLKELHDLKHLTELTLGVTGVTPSGLAKLQESLPTLRIYDESTAFTRIKKLGGKVQRLGNRVNGPVQQVSFEEEIHGGDVSQLPFIVFRQLAKPKPITDADMHEFQGLRGVTTLKEVSFSGCTQITDAGLKEVAQLKYLNTLYFRDCTKITGHGLSVFKESDSLQRLYLINCTQFTDSDIKSLAQLRQLKWLCLSGCTQITDVGIAKLKQLKNLTSLDLTLTHISGAGLNALKELEHLTRLELQQCHNITNDDMLELGGFTNLTSLRLTGTQITDLGMREFANLKKLTFIDLSFNQITDVGLNDLRELKDLKELQFIDDVQITNLGCKKLKEFLPDVQIRR